MTQRRFAGEDAQPDRVLAGPGGPAGVPGGKDHAEPVPEQRTPAGAVEQAGMTGCMHADTAQSAIDTFVSAFNASDDAYVTSLLSQALTSDVVLWGPLGRSEGIEAVERFVLDIRRHPAGPGTMVRCSGVDMPDEWARYRWVFTTPGGGPRLAGTDVVHLRRGLIDQMIVFAGDLSPAG